MYKWKVCPIQGRQLKDVREEDIFGDFRICDTYRGGGGYDQFPYVAANRMDITQFRGNIGKQFVVQLYGCHLNCPYCYVTSDGVRGKIKEYTSTALVLVEFLRAYHRYNCGVFHLMGGSPALYIDYWHEILDILPPIFIFHSDLLLTEKLYPDLSTLRRPNTLYAVNIKGVTDEDHYRNTGKEINWGIFWANFDKLVSSGSEFYITFTNPDLRNLDNFKEEFVNRYGEWVLKDSFVIDLIKYDALKVKNNGISN
jgi:pyruvate-formate lyase-activating enzyme